MTTEHRVTVGSDQLTSQIRITNTGNESAYQVRVAVEMAGRLTQGPVRERLNVAEVLEEEFRLPLLFDKPGKYPLIVTVTYSDSNRHPFSAISIGEAVYGPPVESRVEGDLRVEPFSRKGKARVRLQNQSDREQQFHVRLVLPAEISEDRERRSLTLAPGEAVSSEFKLTNRSASGGSRYGIYALVTYEDEVQHYMHPLTATIQIVPFESFVKRHTRLLTGLALFLLLIVVSLNLSVSSRKGTGSLR